MISWKDATKDAFPAWFFMFSIVEYIGLELLYNFFSRYACDDPLVYELRDDTSNPVVDPVSGLPEIKNYCLFSRAWQFQNISLYSCARKSLPMYPLQWSPLHAWHGSRHWLWLIDWLVPPELWQVSQLRHNILQPELAPRDPGNRHHHLQVLAWVLSRRPSPNRQLCHYLQYQLALWSVSRHSYALCQWVILPFLASNSNSSYDIELQWILQLCHWRHCWVSLLNFKHGYHCTSVLQVLLYQWSGQSLSEQCRGWRRWQFDHLLHLGRRLESDWPHWICMSK